jgi:hypothetical protein
MGPQLEEKLANLWNAGYTGYFSVEHHSGKNEYAKVAVQLAKVRNVLERFRAGQSQLVKQPGEGTSRKQNHGLFASIVKVLPYRSGTRGICPQTGFLGLVPAGAAHAPLSLRPSEFP